MSSVASVDTSHGPSKWFPRVTAGYLVLLFAVNVYRAWTQSLTTDEAYSYSTFPAVRPINMLNTYATQYHLLHTALVFLSTRLFGLSVFTLRLPSVLSSALYFTAAYRISRFWFGVTPMLLLSTTILTLNPLLLDHMSVSRGYGMALAFFAWAFYECLLNRQNPASKWHLFRAGICLALSVAANPTFLFPGLGLALLVIAVEIADRRTAGSASQRTWRVVDLFAGPGVVTVTLLIALPVNHVSERAFSQYMEPGSARSMVDSLLTTSLHYRGCDLNDAPGCTYASLETYGYRAAQFLWALCAAATAFLMWRKIRMAPRGAEDNDGGLLAAGTLTLSTACVVFTALLMQWSYPWVRTGLFYLFLTPLCFLAACRWLWSLGSRGRPAAWLCTAALVALAAVFAAEFDTRYYIEWRFDAGNREILQRVQALHGANARPARMIAGFPLNWSMDLYRRIFGLRWLQPVEIKQPEKGYDYYILRRDDSHYIQELGLRTVYQHQLSGVTLAVP